MTNSFVYFIEFSKKTAFFKLDNVFPECALYREKTNVPSLICLKEDNVCHVGKNCMDTLAKRVHVLFENIAVKSTSIFLYFKELNKLKSGVFFGDDRYPRLINLNPFAWKLIKKRGSVYQFFPHPSFYLTGITDPPKEISS